MPSAINASLYNPSPPSTPPMVSPTSAATSMTPSAAPTNMRAAAAAAAAAVNGNGAAAGRAPAPAAACKVPKFLRSLYAILQTEDPAVIAWVQNETLEPNRVTAFHILDMARFEKEILPKYFKHQKFASFQRQLNNFGFRKWTKTQSSGVCTFSHNCFPPDPNHTGMMRASMRDQWRRKSSPMTSAMSQAILEGPSRRKVGNGITKAAQRKARHQQQQQYHASMRSGESFMELFKSPLNMSNAAAMDFYRQQKTGMEAFSDESVKQFMLPPLQPHHMGRGPYSSALDPALCGYRNDVKPFDYHVAEHQQHMQQQQQQQCGVDANMAASFLEPWAWDSQVASGIEFAAFPLDFDWHPEAKDAAQFQQQQQQFAQDRSLPSGSVEEFGLEGLLFVE